MKLIDRYLVGEMVGPAFAALLSFVVLLTGHVLFQIVDDIAGKGIRLDNIARFAALKTPDAAVFALPAATMLGCALALNRLASDNEIVPLLAGGVGGVRLMGAAMAVGVMATLLSFGLKEYVVPIADQRAEELKREMLLRQKTLVFKPGKFVDTGGNWVFITQGVDQGTDTLFGLRALMRRPGEMPLVYYARQGRFQDNTLWLQDVLALQFAFPSDVSRVTSPEGRIHLEQVSFGSFSGQTDSNESLRALLDRRAQLRTGPAGSTRRLDLEINTRLANATACFVFALLAAPIAMRFGRGQSLAGVLVTLVVGFAYFLIGLGLRLLGGNGTLPVSVAAWAQNALLAVAAVMAMRRV